MAETGKLKLKACMTLKSRAKGNLIFGLGSCGFWRIGHWCRRIWDLIKGVKTQHLQQLGVEEGFGATPEQSVLGVMVKVTMESDQSN